MQWDLAQAQDERAPRACVQALKLGGTQWSQLEMEESKGLQL